MRVHVEATNFVVDSKLVEFAEKKISKLQEHHQDISSAEVIFKVENFKGLENKLTEIIMKAPGMNAVAKKTYKTFEEGVDKCLEAIDKQLSKNKDVVR